VRIALTHLRHARGGGTEGYLTQLAASLARAGHEVVIVCRSHADPPDPRVRFVRLRPVSLGGAWRAWSFARAVERHVAGERYDLVVGLGRTWSQDVLRLGGGMHATYLELAHAASRTWADRWLGLDAHKQRVALAIERRALAPGRARLVIANSELVRRDVLARFGPPPERVAVVPNGVDLERFHPRRRAAEGLQLRRAAGLSSGELVLLFLGNGYGRKGLDLLLEAFPALLDHEPRAHLLVVGGDSASARYARRARALGLRDHARFLGARSDPELCYAAADLYVLPTRYDPFANSTLEALASGLPVVTSTTNGGGELLDEGQSGALVDVHACGATARLAQALIDWSERERLRAGGLAARALAERHSIASKLARTLDLLERVARERQAGADSAR
jgi:UDP-glucose:(heptosyl)LPS alpha-1,3-glucosyltransferase